MDLFGIINFEKEPEESESKNILYDLFEKYRNHECINRVKY